MVMTQQTNTNSIGSNNNHNPNIGRGRGRGGRGFGGRGRSSCRSCRNNTLINKLLFEGKLKDTCLYNKHTITEGSHQDTQLKKICDILPIN